MPINDRPVDLACRDDLPGAVDRLYLEGQTAAGGVARRCCSDLDAASHRGRTAVFDPDRGADRRLTESSKAAAARTVAASIHAINRGVPRTGTSPLPSAVAVSASVTS